ncbi:hypothetical protein [Haloechinothrix salitolerans]|uniref:Uncharacterized protein n=1 Tax=Haloechinothrix salitolerans TaxID=926830 RepID=A0ABW2C3N0_9PSEU
MSRAPRLADGARGMERHNALNPVEYQADQSRRDEHGPSGVYGESSQA